MARRRHGTGRDHLPAFPCQVQTLTGVGDGGETLVAFILGLRKNFTFCSKSSRFTHAEALLRNQTLETGLSAANSQLSRGCLTVQLAHGSPTPWLTPFSFSALLFLGISASLTEARQMNEDAQLTCVFRDISSSGKMLCWTPGADFATADRFSHRSFASRRLCQLTCERTSVPPALPASQACAQEMASDSASPSPR